MGAESDAWGERPEDVLLCTHQEESGHCSLPYGHDGGHVFPPAKPDGEATCGAEFPGPRGAVAICSRPAGHPPRIMDGVGHAEV